MIKFYLCKDIIKKYKSMKKRNKFVTTMIQINMDSTNSQVHVVLF